MTTGHTHLKVRILVLFISIMTLVAITPQDDVSRDDMVARSSATVDGHWSNYLNMYFDDRATGSYCDGSPGFGYGGVPTNGNITVELAWDARTCLRLVDSSGSSTVTATYSRTLSGHWNLSFWMALDAISPANTLSAYLYNGTDAILMVGADQTNIYYWNGASHNIQASAARTWFRFAIDLDTTTRLFDVYLNDACVASSVAFNPAYPLDNQFTHIRFQTGSTATGTTYVENLQYYWWDPTSYGTTDLWESQLAGLEYLYDDWYIPGSTDLLGSGTPLPGYDNLTTRTYPRQVVAATMDAANQAYAVTGFEKWYDMAVDLARWLVEVAQEDDGHFPFVGGTVPNMPNNLLTSSECACALLRMYETTGNASLLDSANAALAFCISTCWNDTLGLFNDYEGTEYVRINFNTGAAMDFAFAYSVTGNTTYRDVATSVLDALPQYMMTYENETGISQSYPGRGSYPLFAGDVDAQDVGYESWSAYGYGMAILFLKNAGYPLGKVLEWTEYFEKQVYYLDEARLYYEDVWMGSWDYLCLQRVFTIYSMLAYDEDLYRIVDVSDSTATYLLARAEQLPNAYGQTARYPSASAWEFYFNGHTTYVGMCRFSHLMDDTELVGFPDYCGATGGVRWLGDDPNQEQYITNYIGADGNVSYNRFVSNESWIVMNASTDADCAITITDYGSSGMSLNLSFEADTTISMVLLGLNQTLVYSVYIDDELVSYSREVDTDGNLSLEFTGEAGFHTIEVYETTETDHMRVMLLVVFAILPIVIIAMLLAVVIGGRRKK